MPHMGMVMAPPPIIPGGQKPAKPKEAPSIMMASSLKAELALRAADHEELVVEAHTLEEKLKAADLGGLKDLNQASAQDEEAAQEAAPQQMMMEAMGATVRKPGEPVFRYVAKISDDDRVKVIADAYHDAERQVHRLAKAAGAAVGPVQKLAEHWLDPEDPEESIEPDNPFGIRTYPLAMVQSGTGAVNPRDAQEAVGTHPDRVVFRVALAASFELRRPAGK